MKYLIGVCAALLLALGLTAWQLKSAWQANTELQARAVEAERQSSRLTGRLDALDRAMGELVAGTRANQERLDQTLGAIQTLSQTEEDSDETMSCLDLPVPRDLDRLLRRATGDALRGDPVSQ